MESRYRNGMVNGDIVLELEKIIEALQKELTAMTADRDRWKALSNDTPVKMVLDDYTQWLSDFGYLDEDVFSEIPKAVDRYLEDRKTRPVPPVQPVFLRGMVEDLKRDCPACGGSGKLKNG